MGFVREEISKEDKKKYGIEYSDFWLIDREREMLFYHFWGNYRGRENHFRLCYKGECVELGGRWKSDPNEAEKIQWEEVFIFKIPEKIESFRREIISSIVEAFKAYGVLNSPSGRDDNKVTRVIFDKRMNIIEGV